jgi:hypothetical protein
MIYNIRHRTGSKISGRTPYNGETLENKIERILENKEGITEVSERIYGTREEGVIPSTNIRSDRWDAAVDAMDAANMSKIAKREARTNQSKKAETVGEQAKEGMSKEGQSSPE